MKSFAITATIVSLALIEAAACRGADETNVLQQVVSLGLPKLSSELPTYYSEGAKARAERIEASIADMIAFYRERLGIQESINLAVLNEKDWKSVNPNPYGLPNAYGPPPVIFMPATTGGFAFHLMEARKDAIPADVLKAYLETNHTTFETASEDFVDAIGFHELGHALCLRYGIDPQCRWLNEFIASYFEYAYISERRPDSKRVFDLLGRPSWARPKNRTLADFERLYSGVDDLGWYHGMFETRIRELYPKMGLQFLKELRGQFPAAAGDHQGVFVPTPVPPEQLLEELEKIAPGFKDWATGFR